MSLLVLTGCGDKSTSWYVGHCAAGDRSYVLSFSFVEDSYRYKEHLSRLSKKYGLDYAELVDGYEAFRPTDSVAKSCGKVKDYETAKGFTFAEDRGREERIRWEAEIARQKKEMVEAAKVESDLLLELRNEKQKLARQKFEASERQKLDRRN